ncbi:MAG: DNA recombination/repair protein RecA, partial [Clostridia bacterium]|nr:DNA recombination/repair protein RecA [Clostridia bacterium]
SKSNCVAIFINQLREKVGVMYGNPEVTPGGRALKFYSSVRLDVRKKEVLKNGSEVVGSRTKVKVVKNKVAPPFREVEFDIMYGQGISRVGDLLDLAERLEIVQKSGAWFSYNGTRIGQGRDNAKNFLRDNPDIFEEVAEKVRENAAKLYAKPTKSGAEVKPAATPVVMPAAPAEKASTQKSVKADIDITVDDDE